MNNKGEYMGKDLFDYIVVPTKNELRKNNCIDKIYALPTLKIPKNGWQIWNRNNYSDYLVQDAIINYNNAIVVAKYDFCSAIKYHKYYCKTLDSNYDFWSRKYLEQTIKELYSIYDKSMYVINYVYDFRVLSDMSFKNNVRIKLKEVDKKIYKKVNRIYSKLYGTEELNAIRDNITHNSSDFFMRYIPIYINEKTSWELVDGMEYCEIIKIIEHISDLLGENKEIIESILKSKYGNTNL